MRHPHDLIAALVDGSLPDERHDSLEAHLRACPECRELHDELEHGEELLRIPEPEIKLTGLGPARRPSRTGAALVLAAATVVLVVLARFAASSAPAASSVASPSVSERRASPTANHVGTASASPAPSASATASPVGTAAKPSATPVCVTGTGPEAGSAVTVCPARGPVGTTVTLTGVRCANPGQAYASFLFGRNTSDSGAPGAASVYAPASGDTARATFVIPRTLDPYQGGGGGEVTPATYAFRSVPNYCTVAFEVTSR